MKLHAALAGSLIIARGAVPEIGAAWATVLEIAERLDDDEYRLRSLSGLWLFITTVASIATLCPGAKGRSLAERQPDPNDRLICEHMIAVSQYFRATTRAPGELSNASWRITSRPTAVHTLSAFTPTRGSGARRLARILFSQGLPEQAMGADRDSSRSPARPIT